MAQLTTAGRKRVSKGNFAIVKKVRNKRTGKMTEQRKYPIHDLAHARNALARVAAHGTPSEKATVKRKVYAKYPGLKKRAQKRSGKK
jgi:hypothetical protein